MRLLQFLMATVRAQSVLTTNKFFAPFLKLDNLMAMLVYQFDIKQFQLDKINLAPDKIPKQITKYFSLSEGSFNAAVDPK